MKIRPIFSCLAVAALMAICPLPVGAHLTVTGGLALHLDDVALNLNCGDLTVGSGSTLDLGNGRIEACRNFTLESGAAFDDGSGTLVFNGDWSNDGAYRKHAASTIRLGNACGRVNRVFGSGDADGDGRSDGQEGLGDSDGDGIVNFLDANRHPAISPIADQTIPEDGVAGPIPFSINDADRSAGLLTVRAWSANKQLIPDSNIVLDGTGEHRTITLTPAAEMSGRARITITVGDGFSSVSRAFDVIVYAVDDTPVIVGQSPLATFETAPLSISLDDLMVDDPDSTYPDDFTLSVADGADYSREGAAITAAEGFSGYLTVAVTVSDGNSQSAAYGLQVYVATRKTVTSTDDTGAGSLRQSIADAGPGDIIDLSGVSGTLFLTNGGLTIDGDLTLVGPSGDGLVIDGNDADGIFRISQGAAVTMENIAVTGGRALLNGGGIINHGDLTLRNMAIYDNLAAPTQPAGGRGGGIYNSGRLTMINCTVSGNAATTMGGGVYNSAGGTLSLTHCTFNGNAAEAGGGNIYNTGTLDMTHTIVAGSVSGGEWVDLGTITVNSGNLVADGSHEAAFSGDPRLGPLQDNGGPTFCHALGTGSPAIDAILPADCPVSEDQRGFSRIHDAGRACDIGAVERHDCTLTIVFSGEGDGTVTLEGQGDIGAGCTAECARRYPEGTEVTLNAVAGDDCSFTGWRGADCAGTAACRITIFADTEITAVFGPFDSDGDGIGNAVETATGTDPDNVDTDGDALADGTEDANRNGMIETGETDPRTPDPGPGIPLLVLPQEDGMDTALMAGLVVDYAANGSPSLHRQTRWQISRDESFTALVMEITHAEHRLTLTVPDLVLDGQTTYYWRVCFVGSDGLARMWSSIGRFTTTTASYTDANGNHIPDDQEPSGESDPAIFSLQAGEWRPEVHWLDITADDGTALQVAMTCDTRVTALDFFGHTPANASDIARSCPHRLLTGLFGLRLQVAQAGGGATVRLDFLPALTTEGEMWLKHDTVNGWQDYTGYVSFNAEGTSVTVDLVDGGFGDADGLANGVIVDPSGPAAAATDSGGKGGGGGGCFMSSLLK